MTTFSAILVYYPQKYRLHVTKPPTVFFTAVTTDFNFFVALLDHVITDVTYSRVASYANIPSSLNTDVRAQDLAQSVDSCDVNAGSLT
jgi:hypothetical protein